MISKIMGSELLGSSGVPHLRERDSDKAGKKFFFVSIGSHYFWVSDIF